jgi:hypothetical protein
MSPQETNILTRFHEGCFLFAVPVAGLFLENSTFFESGTNLQKSYMTEEVQFGGEHGSTEQKGGSSGEGLEAQGRRLGVLPETQSAYLDV